MTELFPPTLGDQIAAVKHEIAMRASVYPKWVAARRMTQAKADRELAAMCAVLATLEAIEAGDYATIALLHGKHREGGGG
jgi:hypothetical protein